jgi:hypothetical protein
MRLYLLRSASIALTVSLFLSPPTLAAVMTIPLTEAAKKWLAAEGIKDASADLKVLIEAGNADNEKVRAARRHFEEAILNGKPLDRKKHSLAVALNLLRLDGLTCHVLVPDYKKGDVLGFIKVAPKTLPDGAYQSDFDLSAIPGLKALGKVEYRIKKMSPTADHFQLIKNKPETARLSFRLKLRVEAKRSKEEYRFKLGPYRITAWQDVRWDKRQKWK